MNKTESVPTHEKSRAELIQERAKLLAELVENMKINYAGGGFHEYDNMDASAGVEHHARRTQLQGLIANANEKLGLPRDSREEVKE